MATEFRSSVILNRFVAAEEELQPGFSELFERRYGSRRCKLPSAAAVKSSLTTTVPCWFWALAVKLFAILSFGVFEY